MKKILSVGTVVIGLALCVWLYFTPHLALKSMRTAVESRSGEQLARHVDFPVLRESLKARLNAKLSERATKEGQTHPLSGLSDALFSKMVAPMVEKMITPENLMTLFNSGAMAFASRPSQQDRAGSKEPKQAQGSGQDTKSNQDISLSYEGFNRFSASLKKQGSSDTPLTIYLQRQGLATWKLVDVELPL